MPALETARLCVRPLRAEDLNVVHRILDVELADADFGSEGASSFAQREEWLQWTIRNYLQLARLYQPPYGDRAIALKSSDEVIGVCGFVPSFGPFSQLPGFDDATEPGAARLYRPELGLFYAVSVHAQRRGYAAEAARAMADYAFQHLRLQRLVATTTYDNAASIRVMQKLGMQILRNPHPEPPWFQVVGVLANRAVR